MEVVCICGGKEVLPAAPAIRIQTGRAWAAKESETAIRRRRALRRVDRELEKGNYKTALSLVKQLKAHPACLLQGFAHAKVPQSVDEVKLMGQIEKPSLGLVVDAILQSIKSSLEFQLREEETMVSLQDLGTAMDAESTYNSIYEDQQMCMQHEAGHFLVGYMLGVLPRRYKVPSLEDLLQDNFVRGKVEFVGFEFLRDVGEDAISNKNLSYTKKHKILSKGKLSNQVLTRNTRRLGCRASAIRILGITSLGCSEAGQSIQVAGLHGE